MAVTTISVSDDVRKQLLKIAAYLQGNLGERVDYDAVIRYLLSKATRSEALLREACAAAGLRSAELRRELRRGRGEDRKREEALERRYS